MAHLGEEGKVNTTSHTVVLVMKQRKRNAGARLTFFFLFSTGFQSAEWYHPKVEWASQLQII